MAIQLSTGLRNKMLDGGASGGMKGALSLGFINIYSGPQPLTADSAATGTLLGTVSVDAGGTGLTFESAAAGVLTKKASEVWRFIGLADGTAGYARFYQAGGNPAASSTAEARLDDVCTSGGLLGYVLSNISVRIGIPNTVDTWAFTQPAK